MHWLKNYIADVKRWMQDVCAKAFGWDDDPFLGT